MKPEILEKRKLTRGIGKRETLDLKINTHLADDRIMLLQLETTNQVFKNTNAYNSLCHTTVTEMACNEKVIMCVLSHCRSSTDL